MIAWRGVVFKGEVWAWPALLFDHEQAFARAPMLRKYTCRWRQWAPGSIVDFDPGCTLQDQDLVLAWLDQIGARGG